MSDIGAGGSTGLGDTIDEAKRCQSEGSATGNLVSYLYPVPASLDLSRTGPYIGTFAETIETGYLLHLVSHCIHPFPTLDAEAEISTR